MPASQATSALTTTQHLSHATCLQGSLRQPPVRPKKAEAEGPEEELPPREVPGDWPLGPAVRQHSRSQGTKAQSHAQQSVRLGHRATAPHKKEQIHQSRRAPAQKGCGAGPTTLKASKLGAKNTHVP